MTAASCGHSSDTICPACNDQRRDAYLRRHGPNKDFPHPDRHPFHSDGSGLTCVRCELPDGNRIHTMAGGF